MFACSGLICYINKISLNYSAHSIYNVKPYQALSNVAAFLFDPAPVRPQGTNKSNMSNNAATACHVPANKC